MATRCAFGVRPKRARQGQRETFSFSLRTRLSVFDYHAFGGLLRSELELPDFLPATCDRADWTIRLATRPLPDVSRTLRGEFEPLPGLLLRLFDLATGLRLAGDRIGTWDILQRGREIVWYAETPEQKEFFRTILLGPVLSLVLEQQGLLALHGSAVNLDGSAVAFLAPKLHGKSTLALALTLSGGRLITDDLVAVDLGNPNLVRPGAHGVRLFGDSVERLRVGQLQRMRSGEIKHTLNALAPHMLQCVPTSLAAIYLLEPMDEQPDVPAANRYQLNGAEAVIGVAHRMKLPDNLIGYAAAGVRLALIAQLLNSVPVYKLRLVPAWERLEESVRMLRSWHADDGRARDHSARVRPSTASVAIQ